MTEAITHIHCNFCGKERSEVDKLIVANDAGICNECIELCSSILSKEKRDLIRKDKKISRALDPVKITQHLNQYVIGQEQAKMALSVGVVNHYKRIHFESEVDLEKSNILLFGPTGSGKTLLARSIARYLNVPFVIADATTLTEAGYVGEDVESVVSRLLAEAEYDVERCQQGIIFLDEIDKIARKSESASLVRDVSGEGVQQALLKLVEGTKCKITVSNYKGSHAHDPIEVDTSNILFIAAGSFSGLEQIINQRHNRTGIGFAAGLKGGHVQVKNAIPEDFVKFGMIPEFTGRFPIFVGLENLSVASLVRILTEPKNNLIQQMQFYFKTDDLDLEFDAGAIEAVAEKAHELKIGARGLKTVLEQYLTPYLYNIHEYKDLAVKKIKISADSIKYNQEPEFI